MNTVNLEKLGQHAAKTGMGHQKWHDDTFDADTIKTVQSAVNDALTSIEGSRQKCLIAGQMLNEVQARLPHGKFESWIEKYLPKISYETANRWAKAGANIMKALPPAPVDIDVSVILATPDKQLPPAQLKYKQQWFNLTENKTIKDCCAGVFVEGDEAHRLSRAINGKTKGGKGNVNRKDFPAFIGTKLAHLTTHLEHYSNFTAPQLERTNLLVRGNVAKWPSAFLELVVKEAKEELKKR